MYNIYNYTSVSVYIDILKYLYFTICISNQEFVLMPLIRTQYLRVLSSFLPLLTCSPFSDSDELDSCYVSSILPLLPSPHSRTLLFLLRVWCPTLGITLLRPTTVPTLLVQTPSSPRAEAAFLSQSDACLVRPCLMTFVLNFARRRGREMSTLYLKLFLVYYTVFFFHLFLLVGG